MNLSPQELIDNFSFLDDWEERYAYIIDLGKKLQPMPDELKTDATKISGCLSQVWIHHQFIENDDGVTVIHYQADSDAVIVRGLIGLLLSLCQNQSPNTIISIKFDEIMQEIGLDQHLSPNRRNGFAAMIERIKAPAKNA